ncbi:hypothetical protein [Nocardia sp. CA-135398]|uniref:hypothetical protein n=1 Tax=Nocardia sp. CA-135398 TaxID=3239977 RepID=UPI003D991E0B
MAYIRISNASDLDELNSVDAQCFPPEAKVHEPASELRDGRKFVSADDDEESSGLIHFGRMYRQHNPRADFLITVPSSGLVAIREVSSG